MGHIVQTAKETESKKRLFKSRLESLLLTAEKRNPFFPMRISFPRPTWEQVVNSLNQMGCSVRVGGRSALELQGMAHYLPLGDPQRIL